MTNCPCCSNKMLRHIRHHHVYWFCRNCWQEMPLLEQQSLGIVSPVLERHLAPLRLKRLLVTV